MLWENELFDAILAFLRQRIGNHVNRPYSTTLELTTGAVGLRNVRSQTSYVQTSADRQLRAAARGISGGSIALSGPRGVGKSELLHQICPRSPDQAGFVVNVPVIFDRREFMLHLFARVCEFAIDQGLEPRQAEKKLMSIRYLQTYSAETTAGIGWRGMNLGRKHGSGKARQPLTYPEIVDELRRYLSFLGTLLGQKVRQRLVIGIDELDRIEPIDRAREFLNEIKAVFDVPNCLFVLSASDEALHRADLAQPGRRDEFDSAIDEVVRVKPLRYLEAKQLIDQRVIGVPEPFIALFHCLSGGLPRELLRIARATTIHASQNQPCTLSDATTYLIDRELERGLTGPVHQVFHVTLRQIFTDGLSQQQLARATEAEFVGSFDALAAARAGEASSALTAVTTICRAWHIRVPHRPVRGIHKLPLTRTTG